MPHSHQGPFVPTGDCLLHRMPDELLCRTLEYLAPAPTSHSGFQYEPCLSISLVCRRWERLYSSFLYRNIDLGYSGWQKPRRIRQLEATLRQRSDLCDAVRMVDFQHNHPSDATCEMIADILSYAKGLRNFGLHTKYTQSTWQILNAAKRAPLARLKLSGCEGGPSLQMILKHFSLPTLKEVSVNNYGLGNEDEPGADNSLDATQQELDLLLSSASPCNVTTMELSEPIAPTHVTKSFLQWPARLTSLTMRSCSYWYTIDAVQEMLDDHRHTLQHISLPELAPGFSNLPDFSSFTSLETLQIHGHNLFEEPSCAAAAQLSAPRLRHLKISFDTEDQHQTPYEDFEADRIDWLKDFVGYIKPTTHSLETVFVEFEPEVSISDRNWFDSATWPWSYIEQAVGLFAGHNVTMTYTQPHYSRKEWDLAVKRAKEEADARQARVDLMQSQIRGVIV